MIAQERNVCFARAYGFSDAVKNHLNNVNTQFLIGSVTKQFTAAAVLKSLYEQERVDYPEITEDQLVENVRYKLHSPLSQFLPQDDPLWEGHSPQWLDEVTLHHLLCHTSGIPSYTSDPSFVEFSKYDHSSLGEVVAIFREKPLEFSPGEKWNYSNSGYILLGAVVERMTKSRIEDYFEKTFFTPLAMQSTVMPSKRRVSELKESFPNLARGYAWDLFDVKAPLVEQPMYENMLHAHAAGAIISTVEDLHRWNIALFEEEKILPRSLVNLMVDKHMLVDPMAPNVFYAYGLSTQREPDLPLIGHHGSIPGYFSVLHYYPKQKMTLVTLQNVSGNSEQQAMLYKELQKQFGHLKEGEERYRLEDEYIKENYPHMQQQEQAHNFAAPLIDFFEKQRQRHEQLFVKYHGDISFRGKE